MVSKILVVKYLILRVKFNLRISGGFWDPEITAHLSILKSRVRLQFNVDLPYDLVLRHPRDVIDHTQVNMSKKSAC